MKTYKGHGKIETGEGVGTKVVLLLSHQHAKIGGKFDFSASIWDNTAVVRRGPVGPAGISFLQQEKQHEDG